MALTPTYPGVYVQEVPSGVRTIAGVSTSVTLLVGAAGAGPIGQPVLCLNYTDYVNAFGAVNALGDMGRYVRLFFLNGGTRCYVMRIANNALTSSVVVEAESAGGGVRAMELSAKSAGRLGETIRATVSYKGQFPEITFNMDVFQVDADGNVSGLEQYTNLTMDPRSANYAPAVLTQRSDLVDGIFGPTPTDEPPAQAGISRSGRPVDSTGWGTILPGAGAGDNAFGISVDGSPYHPVDIGAVAAGTLEADLAAAVVAAFPPGSGVNVVAELIAGPTTGTQLLQIRTNGPHGNVLIRPGGANDITATLMLGTMQGGAEIGAYAHRRPAPTGAALPQAAMATLAGLVQDSVGTITIDGTPIDVSAAFERTADPTTEPVWQSADTTAPHGGSNGVAETLAGVRDAINAEQAASPRSFFYKAEVHGTRLAIVPTSGAANDEATVAATGLTFQASTRFYSLGATGTGTFQTPGVQGDDGNAPLPTDYDAAYLVADGEVDLFNLMVLPPSSGATYQHHTLYAQASVFCQQKRAFLLMDAPEDWASAQDVLDNVDALRVGLVNDHAAVYYPNLVINENGLRQQVGASGAMAGLHARIDASRGVWKAAAGTEASLRGIVGVSQRLSDGENGVVNPEGVNALRVFPDGIVSWGARTLEGADAFGSEYKYVPIRRLALFIEESLYQGMTWAVFEPNDEPLWAQVRLNVGTFMHNLFRQGAFQGATPSAAYFVKCDGETTTQADRDRGIVNVWVGFAPLKPAEFVILYLQQMAGQVQS